MKEKNEDEEVWAYTICIHIERGHEDKEENGDNRWVEGERTHHAYLILKEDPETMAHLIESLMLGAF